MILTSITEAVPFTPPWLEGTPNAPKFHLRAGTTVERGLMLAMLDGPLQAAKVWSHQLREAQLKGIDALFADDLEYDRLVEIFSAEGEEAEALSDADKKLAQDVEPLLVAHWPDYAALVEQMQRRRTLVPIVALTRYCTGWENVRDDKGELIPFETDRNSHHVADRALRRLQELDLQLAGARAFNLQFGGGEEKNSERPSSSDGGRKTSKAASPRAKAGRSRARGGRKTPA